MVHCANIRGPRDSQSGESSSHVSLQKGADEVVRWLCINAVICIVVYLMNAL